MLFELKISTDNAAEFSSFGAEFSRFIDAWNAKQSNSPAGLPAMTPVAGDRKVDTDHSLNATGAINSAREIPGVKSNASMVSPEPPPAISAPETVSPHSPAVSGAEVSEEKPKRTRRTKAEMEASRAAAMGAELPKTNGAGAAGVSTVPSDVTLDDVKAAYNAMCRALGPKSRGVSSEMLLELGVAKFSDLKPEQFAVAIDKMNRKASQQTKTAEAIDDEIRF